MAIYVQHALCYHWYMMILYGQVQEVKNTYTPKQCAQIGKYVEEYMLGISHYLNVEIKLVTLAQPCNFLCLQQVWIFKIWRSFARLPIHQI